MVQGVAVLWMPLEDIERAKGFYRDTLGLPIPKEDGPWAEGGAHGPTIGLNEGGLDETVGGLKDQGVEFPAGISEHDWGRVATFKDSEGNDIQLYEPPNG